MEEFLKPLGMTQKELSERTGIPYRHVQGLVHERRNLDVDTALLLGRFFDVSAQFWLNFQLRRDLFEGQQRCEDKLRAIQPCQTGADARH